MGRRWVRQLAVQDWVVLAYLLVLLGAVVAGQGPRRSTAIVCAACDLALFVAALVVTRGEWVRGEWVRGAAGALVYRAGLFVAMFGSFSHLQHILPTARAVVVDAELYALDLRVLGFEPALAFDRYVTPATTEWFSFFYFGYFLIVAGHVFPMLLTRQPPRLLAEFALGFLALFCVGHVLYMIVPGHGPYQHLAGRFEHDLSGPVWWRAVKSTVDSVEVTARTDIFPSLHTGAPTYLALFSIRHRRLMPFRFTWLPLTIATSQIVLSTMFLRWHYAVDVAAGLALATAVATIAPRVVAWETRRRARLGAGPVWTMPWEPARAPARAPALA
ncbi:MAG: phosphatase PAP2 family protein [Labilithrix sp.]|nr:phosphatase PAP2 family protein [Labilithrix sp.]MCW5813089.1 phosphatase PAP2 family protein [Labilithrix sp.]